jgi:sulfate adenylyltransferase
LVQGICKWAERNRLLAAVARLPCLDISAEVVGDVWNLGIGAFSPLERFMGPEDFRATLYDKHLASGIPWTIPIVLDVSARQTDHLEETVGLWYAGRALALLTDIVPYRYERQEFAKQVFGTEDPKHPGVAHVLHMREVLLAGPVTVLGEVDTPFARYRLTPLETRVLFTAKGWRTVVGFQTRNVPHLGHEYVQKTALIFVDGIFINPVIGRKKAGDFKDEVILKTYDALTQHYYLRERAVLATLHTEMRYAGPREAILGRSIYRSL